MTGPWLSVLMPVHAGAEWLDRTLESVAREPTEGVEMLILDSTPDDSCEEIVTRYTKRLSIRYRRTPDILPWPAKMNAAAQIARGGHIAMLHQDDLWLPGRIAAVRRAIAAWPDAALFLNPSQIVDGAGRAMGVWQCPLPPNVRLGTSEVADRLLIQNFISMPASIIRTQAWLEAGGMDDSLWYTADWDLYLKIADQGDTLYSLDVTTAFRIHRGSLTVKGSRDTAGFLEQMERVIDRHIGLAPAVGRQRTLKTARVSAAINTALAATAHGRRIAIVEAVWALLTLSPTEFVRYVRNSRIHERVLPRLRAKMAGSL
jgi:glycosyltransferase involved in cell wall biosynthesis